MPDKPILIFPAATVAERQNAPTGGPQTPPPRPSRQAQAERLTSRFESLGGEFGTAQAHPDGLDPEQVIVLETIGSLEDFQNVVKRIAGMEWLGDFDAEVEASDLGFLVDGEDPSLIRARLFVMASNRTAYNEVLRLWRLWQAADDDRLPRPYGALANAFKYLNDVRPWGAKDRVSASGVVEYWESGMQANQPTIRFEAELWCRTDAAKRAAAYGRFEATVRELGGQCITQAALPEVDYHGVLLDMPADVVRQAVEAINAESDAVLLRLTDVKYFAPIGQASVALLDDGAPVPPPDRPVPTDEPVVAILDGLPLTNHAALQDRLLVDDADNLAESYEAGEHRHGTAMASLVAHGEYDGEGPSLGSRIYLRPIMAPGRPDANGKRLETFPPDELAVDLVHRAVRRMFEGEGGTPPQARGVKVINLSVGDRGQLFDREVSPWARLLDWLAWKYGVLFVISAGNHLDSIVIPVPPAAVAGMSGQELLGHALRAMAHQRLQRRLLAPAESLNGLTGGRTALASCRNR